MPESYNLQRFLTAQENVYPDVLTELRQGRKQTHWMWFIFPQIQGLGRSSTARYYAIADLDEARAYLADETLNRRLREVCQIIFDCPETDAKTIFGGIDSMKLRSSMTLFDLVVPNDIFARVLEKFFNGHRDRRTLEL